SPRTGRAPSPVVVPTLPRLLLVAAAAEADLLLDRVHPAFDRPLALRLGGLLLAFLEQVGDALRLVRRAQVEAVDGLGEAQVGIHARDHDPEVDGQEL